MGTGKEYNTILNRFLFDATMNLNGRDTYDVHTFERRQTNFQCNYDGIDIRINYCSIWIYKDETWNSELWRMVEIAFCANRRYSSLISNLSILLEVWSRVLFCIGGRSRKQIIRMAS